jgi:hypothetical protein
VAGLSSCLLRGVPGGLVYLVPSRARQTGDRLILSVPFVGALYSLFFSPHLLPPDTAMMFRLDPVGRQRGHQQPAKGARPAAPWR